MHITTKHIVAKCTLQCSTIMQRMLYWSRYQQQLTEQQQEQDNLGAKINKTTGRVTVAQTRNSVQQKVISTQTQTVELKTRTAGAQQDFMRCKADKTHHGHRRYTYDQWHKTLMEETPTLTYRICNTHHNTLPNKDERLLARQSLIPSLATSAALHMPLSRDTLCVQCLRYFATHPTLCRS